MLELHTLTIHQAGDLLRRREITSSELTEAALKRIQEVEGRLRALVTVTPELARHQAQEADQRIKSGEATPLTGIPAIIKDNICTQGITTTCSSRMLQNFIPPYDATVVEKLKGAGMVMVGKSNLDEFAMGSSTENSAFFVTANPWDQDRVPGGSSGGSAAAVAAGEAMYALGSDTGGSIRQPAGFCSIVGLKPTYGRVSRYGLVAFASSLDQIGPLTRDVTDCALVLQTIAGHDPRDSTSVPQPVPDYSQALVPDLHGLRIGIPQEYYPGEMEPQVSSVLKGAIAKLEELGAEVQWDVSLPHTRYALAAYYIIAPSEASANLARYDGVKYGYSYQEAENMWQAMEKTRQYGFGAEVKRRIMLGTYALSAGYYDAYYLKAQKVRTLIKRDFDQAWERVHALVVPTSPTPPFKIGEKVEEPLQMYLSDIFTIPVNIAGIPGIAVPAGFVKGLPVGMQILGRPFDEATLFRIAYAYQEATEWHQTLPELRDSAL
ncbi:MAG: Asp-tRNA(Asn)/Glu-tRNA(Gln) amidotransferase subunit GatA [Chloroflexi bacterium]|nr:Asp-tRNA(Asn)/Glu-tRNA(Gln) amidotransferase subunit GatA [Chloroflexota bacterium]